MRIYVSHASSYDYATNLYEPLRAAFAANHDLILPHDTDSQGANSRDIIPTCDVVFAEVSYPSTGQGIELGWADAAGVPIICFYRTDEKPSGSLRFVTDNTLAYSAPDDMVDKLQSRFVDYLAL